MNKEPYTTQIGSWTFRVREPEGEGPHPVFLLVHGWTGDENSMWIFSSRLPANHLLIAPRAPHSEGRGGYSWHFREGDRWPSIDDLRPAVDALIEILSPEYFPGGEFSAFRTVGFSQGAALIYSLAFFHPSRVVSMAGLSGFLPDGAENLAENKPLNRKPVFVAHGTQDERVPVERGRKAVQILEQAGAHVTYCEDDVGHKLSLTCFRALESFFKEIK
jgi:phospholipase/carboxylesterase